MNKTALRIAREVADETGTLMAGNINGTGVYSAEDKESHEYARNMFTVSKVTYLALSTIYFPVYTKKAAIVI